MTWLSDQFAKLPRRQARAAKSISCWQNHGENFYHASVEQHCARGDTPEAAIEKALASYLEHP